MLHPANTVLEELTQAAPFDMVPKVRDILGAFLFTGDDVHKKVAILSGGELNRLALAILLLRPANLLLLDEPTNHLDLQSKEVLLDSLKSYRGTLVFVSHDRHFVDAMATRVLEVKGGKVGSYLGDYEDFLCAKASQGDLSHCALRVEQRQTISYPPTDKKEQGRFHKERKEAKKTERRRQRELAEMEECIETLEKELSAMEKAMADPGFYREQEDWRKASIRHGELQKKIADLYARWEELLLSETG
jgi:ATP-binding cassette subfamily F protein 3